MAILQAFAKVGPEVADCIRGRIVSNRLVLFTWSAGTTCCGESAEHTRDRKRTLSHDIDGVPCAVLPERLAFDPRIFFRPSLPI